MDLRVLNLLWPTQRNTAPTELTSVGRVLHWAALVLALLFLMVALSCFVQSTQSGGNDYWDARSFSLLLGVIFGVLAVATYGAGRIARRLLSRE